MDLPVGSVSYAVSLLRKSHPELQEELVELRKHLLESTNDMAPLKVWEMQGIDLYIIELYIYIIDYYTYWASFTNILVSLKFVLKQNT